LGLFLPIAVYLLTDKRAELSPFLKSKSRQDIVLPSLLLILSFTPLILFELNYPSNILKLSSAHLSSAKQQLSFPAVLLAAKSFLTEFFFRGIKGNSLLLSLSAAVTATSLCSFYLFQDRQMRWIASSLISAFVGMILLMYRVAPPVPQYLFHFSLSVPAVLIGLLGSELLTGKSNFIKLSSLCLITLFSLSALNTARWHINTESEGLSQGDQSMLHARELAKIIDRDRVPHQPILVSTHGKRKHKHNGYYFFLGPEQYPLLYQRSSLIELPSLHQKHREVQQLYAVSCWDPGGAPKAAPKSTAKWGFAQLPDLSSCTTCGLCRMAKFYRKAY
jgi:hypothetical protein